MSEYIGKSMKGEFIWNNIRLIQRFEDRCLTLTRCPKGKAHPRTQSSMLTTILYPMYFRIPESTLMMTLESLESTGWTRQTCSLISSTTSATTLRRSRLSTPITRPATILSGFWAMRFLSSVVSSAWQWWRDRD